MNILWITIILFISRSIVESAKVTRIIQYSSQNRTYDIIYPDDLQNGEKLDVVVFFHGEHLKDPLFPHYNWDTFIESSTNTSSNRIIGIFPKSMVVSPGDGLSCKKLSFFGLQTGSCYDIGDSNRPIVWEVPNVENDFLLPFSLEGVDSFTSFFSKVSRCDTRVSRDLGMFQKVLEDVITVSELKGFSIWNVIVGGFEQGGVFAEYLTYCSSRVSSYFSINGGMKIFDLFDWLPYFKFFYPVKPSSDSNFKTKKGLYLHDIKLNSSVGFSYTMSNTAGELLNNAGINNFSVVLMDSSNSTSSSEPIYYSMFENMTDLILSFIRSTSNQSALQLFSSESCFSSIYSTFVGFSFFFDVKDVVNWLVPIVIILIVLIVILIILIILCPIFYCFYCRKGSNNDDDDMRDEENPVDDYDDAPRRGGDDMDGHEEVELDD